MTTVNSDQITDKNQTTVPSGQKNILLSKKSFLNQMSINPKFRNFSVNKIHKYWENQKLPDNQNEPFSDPEFMPNENSLLGLNKNGQPIDPNLFSKFGESMRSLTWKRASEVYKECSIFVDKIEFSDVKQGSLGNCYFLSALAALTEFPNIIYNIFKTKEISKNGLYEIGMFIDGEWQIVIVDDYIPFNIERDTFAFTQPNGVEIWVILLEKAWAKINRGYVNIIGGNPSEPLTAFTGFNVKNIDLENYSKDNDKRKIKETDDENMPDEPQKLSIDDLWNTILESDQLNYIMCCNSKIDNKTCNSINSKNIVTQHAYTLIGAKGINYKGELIRLCKIRNPWGTVEFNGDWSDSSDKWNEELNRIFDHQIKNDSELNDGIFFMSIEDLVKYYDSINICCYMYDSKTKSFEIKNKDFYNPEVFGFYLPEDKNVYISLLRQNWRFNRSFTNKEIPITMLLAKVNQENKITYIDSNFSGEDDSFIVRKFTSGFYIIWIYYPICEDVKRILTDFHLQISSDSIFKASYLTKDSDFSIFYQILENGFKTKYKEELKSQEIFTKRECFSFDKSGIAFFIAANNSNEKYLKIELEINESQGFLIVPPIDNSNRQTLFLSPESMLSVIGIRTVQSGSFNFNTSLKINSKKSSFKNDNTNEINRNKIHNLYKTELNNLELEEDYYQYFTFSKEEAVKILNFTSLDINRVSKERLISLYPKEMNLVLKFEEKDEFKKSKWIRARNNSINSKGYYYGEFNKKEELHGRVLFKYDDGNYIISYYKNNKRDGYSEEYNSNDEIKLKGYFVKDKKEGKFLITDHATGCKFEGEFINDLKVSGSLFNKERKIYEGEFKNGKFFGIGKYYFKENSYWEGPFVSGQMHGKGIYYSKDGRNREMTFNNDKKV